MRSHLDAVLEERRLGIPLEAALDRFAEGIGSDDARLLVAVMSLHARSGGDLGAALEDVLATIRHRLAVRRELRGLTAQGRLSALVLGAVPLGFFLFLAVTSQRDLGPVYRSAAGTVMVLAGLALEGLAFLWIRRILRVEVLSRGASSSPCSPRCAVFAALAGPVAVRAVRRERMFGLLHAPAPPPRSGWLERLGRSRLGRLASPSQEVRRRLPAAGWPLSPDALTGARLVVGGGGLALGLLLTATWPGALVLAPACFLVGARFPDLWLARRVRRRMRAIDRQVSDLVELLVATDGRRAGAGRSRFADRRTCSRAPLGDELSVAVREIDLGVPWRAALDGLVARSEDARAPRARPERSTRSQRLGTSVRTTLRGLATDLRDERRVRAEEAGSARARQDALPPRLPHPSRVPPPHGGAGPPRDAPVPPLRVGRWVRMAKGGEPHMLALSIRITGWLTTVAERLARRIQWVPSAIPALGRDEGQTTAEYALVLPGRGGRGVRPDRVGPVQGKLPAFFDRIIDNITGNVG